MSKLKISLCAITVIALAACSSSDDATPVGKVEEAETTILNEHVEITLIDVLDGVTSSYCIDVAGGNQNIDITKGLQAHTCYSYRGEIGSDQTFSSARFSDNELYMPVFDVCATAASLTAGAAIGLAACDGTDLQKVTFSGSGTIAMRASSDLCFTAAKESRFGRSKVHQIKALSLGPCSSELSAYQMWQGRTSAE